MESKRPVGDLENAGLGQRLEGVLVSAVFRKDRAWPRVEVGIKFLSRVNYTLWLQTSY